LIDNHQTPIQGLLPYGAHSAIGPTNLVFRVFALVQKQPIAYLLPVNYNIQGAIINLLPFLL